MADPEKEQGESRYLRHAKRFGAEGVLEAAAEHLPVRDLMALSRELRSVDPQWKTPPALARAYAVELLAKGDKVADVARRTGLSRPTVYAVQSEVREQAGNMPTQGVFEALQSGESVKKSPDLGAADTYPEQEAA